MNTIALTREEVNIVLNGLLALHDLNKEPYKAECIELYDKIAEQIIKQEQAEREANLQKLAGQLLRAHY